MVKIPLPPQPRGSDRSGHRSLNGGRIPIAHRAFATHVKMVRGIRTNPRGGENRTNPTGRENRTSQEATEFQTPRSFTKARCASCPGGARPRGAASEGIALTASAVTSASDLAAVLSCDRRGALWEQQGATAAAAGASAVRRGCRAAPSKRESSHADHPRGQGDPVLVRRQQSRGQRQSRAAADARPARRQRQSGDPAEPPGLRAWSGAQLRQQSRGLRPPLPLSAGARCRPVRLRRPARPAAAGGRHLHRAAADHPQDEQRQNEFGHRSRRIRRSRPPSKMRCTSAASASASPSIRAPMPVTP